MSTWRTLADEHAALELAELRDRVREFEADIAIYREIAQAGIDALHQAHRREQQLREIVSRLRREIKQLREAQVSATTNVPGRRAA